jgi:hypothetical protein|tara:strand:+ start:5924 stop:7117 length:1194 start_codon:yes stop_codon:yes gene_type:complete
MAKQTINIGSTANDGSGSTLRVGGDIINDNFNEIYTAFGDGSTLTSGFVSATGTVTLTNKTLTSPVIANITSTADIDLTATNDVNIPANVGLTFGDDGEKIEGDGTNLTIASSNALILNSSASSIRVDPNSVTVNVTGDITLDADGDQIKFKDGSTDIGQVDMTDDNLTLTSLVSDKDMVFKGNDGGSTITALTLDMSEAGAATFGGAVTVTGNLTVNGSTTTVNSTNTTIDDNLLELNSGASSNANDTGIIMERGSTGDNAIIAWDESADKFVVGTTTATASDTGNLSITTGTLVGNIEGNVTGNLVGNVTGNVSGTSGSTTGNAATATALATGRTIGMTGDVVWTSASFDGTGNVTGTAALQANTVSSTELVSATTLLILDSSGSTVKTIIGAGS